MLGASKAKSTKDTNNFTVFAHDLPGKTHEGASQKSDNTTPYCQQHIQQHNYGTTWFFTGRIMTTKH